MLLAVIASGTSAGAGPAAVPGRRLLPRLRRPRHADPGRAARGADQRRGAGLRRRVRLLRPAAHRARAAHEPRARPPGGDARALRPAVVVLPDRGVRVRRALPGRPARPCSARRRWRRSPRSAWAGSPSAIALRTGSLSLMQSIFPFVFVLLFTAPAFFPRELLTPALRDVGRVQPAHLHRRGRPRDAHRHRRSATRSPACWRRSRWPWPRPRWRPSRCASG